MDDIYMDDMSCFKLVKTVLDEIYGQLFDQNNKDEKIRTELEDLIQGYKQLRIGEKIPTYNNYHRCFAYLYCFVSAHANIIYDLIKFLPRLHPVFDNDEVRVSCLGGGPGSDILGIQKFMIREKKWTTLHCNIFDRERTWIDFWRCICNNLYSPFRAYSSFSTLDISNPLTQLKYSQIWNADLLMMSFFLSEVYPLRSQVSAFFENMFKQAKVGSYIFFVDNISSGAEEWFDSLVENYNKSNKNHGVEVISSSDRCSFQMETYECKEDLSPYYGRYLDQRGQRLCPRLRGEIVFRICRKQ